MFKVPYIICITLFTTGCLVTEEAILDASNSTPASESAEFFEYTNAERRRVGQSTIKESNFKKNNEGKWIATVGALTIVTDRGANGEYIYYGVGTMSDGTPIKCVSNTTNKKHRSISENALGIKITEIKTGDNLIPQVLIKGDKNKVEKYIFDEFQNGNLLCEISARPVPGG